MSDAILLIKAFESKEFSDLALVVLIIIGVWIFKEVRKGLIEVDKHNSDRIDKALLVYGEIEALLILHLNNNTVDFSQKIVSAYPYFEKKLIKKAYKLIELPDQENIKSFLTLLRDEVMRLKRLQIDPVSIRPGESFFEEMIIFFTRMKFSSFIQPIFFVFITIIVICLLSAFTLVSLKADMYGKIILVALPIATVINLLILMNFIDKISRKMFISNFKNWFTFVVFVILPAFLCWYMHYHWLVILVDLIAVWVYMVIFLKDSIQPEEY